MPLSLSSSLDLWPLTFQIVGALSIMMDMKKGVVNETVKEHRADELSAMYNMMLEQKLKKLGQWPY